MKLYIAGPMTGLPEFNAPEFRRVGTAVEALGHRVVNPVEMDDAEGFVHADHPKGEQGSESEYANFLRRDLLRLLAEDVDGAVVLDGWETSRGALLEVHVLRSLGKGIFRLMRNGLEDVPEARPRPMIGRHPASARFHAILADLGDLHDRKQRDYGRGDDPFANVRASDDFGVPGWIGTAMRANDKMKRLQTAATQYLTTGKISLANEGVIDALDDLAVYAVIGRVLFEEEAGKLMEADN